MTGRPLVLVVLLSTGACAGPTSPTAAVGGFLSGQWAGTLTLWSDDQPPVTGPTTWTFSAIRGTAQHSYTTTIRASHPVLPPIIEGASTTLTPPGVPPAGFSTSGGFESSPGCRVLFGSFGTADTHRIHADFTIAGPCDRPVYGSLDLSR